MLCHFCVIYVGLFLLYKESLVIYIVCIYFGIRKNRFKALMYFKLRQGVCLSRIKSLSVLQSLCLTSSGTGLVQSPMANLCHGSHGNKVIFVSVNIICYLYYWFKSKFMFKWYYFISLYLPVSDTSMKEICLGKDMVTVLYCIKDCLIACGRESIILHHFAFMAMKHCFYEHAMMFL